MKVSQSFPNFVQGVSQQPAPLRSRAHAEALLNGYCSAQLGLSKRPHTEFVAQLDTNAFSSTKLHSFNKSEDEQGCLILKGDGTIVVKGFDGTEATVDINTPGGDVSYITGTPATDRYSVVSVADYTFIVNRSVTPALKADTYFSKDTSSGGYGRSLVWVRTALAETPYTITLTGGTAPTATYNPLSVAANVNTVNIASQLASQINTVGTPAFSATTLGSVIAIHRSGSAYDIDVTDGRGNSAMVLLQQATSNPANLPPIAPDRFQIEVTGDDSTDWDNYWVEWDSSKKVWLEIPKPGRQYQIDPATMPHVLKYIEPGHYSFEQLPWNDCLAGDETTNPEPSFIGRTINDIYFYRGRLGLLHDAGTVLSEAGNLFNFWRTTTTALLDSDPIDVKVTMTNPAPLRWAVEYNDTVFFWSDRAQFSIEKNVEVLSPRTIKVSNVTSYEADVYCEPVAVGDRIYYTRLRDSYASLHDYYPKADAEGRLTYGSEEVTEQAPRYIARRVREIKSAANSNLLILLTGSFNSQDVYVYQYAFKDRTRIQSAIHKWQFDANNIVITAESDGAALFFLFGRPDGMFIERCNIAPNVTDPAMPIKLLLDHRVDETQCSVTYNSGTGKSTIVLPFDDGGSPQQPFVMYGRSPLGGDYIAKPGELVDAEVVDLTPVTLEVDGDWTSYKFYVGKNYLFSFTFSPIILRDRDTEAPITGGRLQINRMFLNYGDTSYFRAVVTPAHRTTYTYAFTGYQLGSSNVLLGDIPVLSGTFRFPVQANNLGVEVKIESDAPFPVHLLNGDWEGQWGSQAIQPARRL